MQPGVPTGEKRASGTKKRGEETAKREREKAQKKAGPNEPPQIVRTA